MRAILGVRVVVSIDGTLDGRFGGVLFGLEVGCGEGSSDFVRDGLVVGIADGKLVRPRLGSVDNISVGLTLGIVGIKDGTLEGHKVRVFVG